MERLRRPARLISSSSSSSSSSSVVFSVVVFYFFFCLLATCPTPIDALKFDLSAHPQGQHKKSERCIRNFVSRDTLVVVTATIGGAKGDGQTVNMHV